MKLIFSPKIKPYVELMRLNKPIGSLLLLWPTLWALWVASNGKPNLNILLIFILGVFIMRSAGCVINDIADRKIDGRVKRTQSRPLALGKISTKNALILFSVLCFLGFLLVLQLNFYTILLSCVALLLAIVYPFTKRITHLPQLMLGAAFAWSVPMVFAAVNHEISFTGWLLYAVATIWPFAYDSIYALMDKEDDLKVGVKSTAILFGKWDIPFIFFLQLSVVLGLLLLGTLLHFNRLYYLGLMIVTVMIGYQIFLISRRTTNDYYRAFYNNHWLGLVVFLSIAQNYY